MHHIRPLLLLRGRRQPLLLLPRPRSCGASHASKAEPWRRPLPPSAGGVLLAAAGQVEVRAAAPLQHRLAEVAEVVAAGVADHVVVGPCQQVVRAAGR